MSVMTFKFVAEQFVLNNPTGSVWADSTKGLYHANFFKNGKVYDYRVTNNQQLYDKLKLNTEGLMDGDRYRGLMSQLADKQNKLSAGIVKGNKLFKTIDRPFSADEIKSLEFEIECLQNELNKAKILY